MDKFRLIGRRGLAAAIVGQLAANAVAFFWRLVANGAAPADITTIDSIAKLRARRQQTPGVVVSGDTGPERKDADIFLMAVKSQVARAAADRVRTAADYTRTRLKSFF